MLEYVRLGELTYSSSIQARVKCRDPLIRTRSEIRSQIYHRQGHVQGLVEKLMVEKGPLIEKGLRMGITITGYVHQQFWYTTS